MPTSNLTIYRSIMMPPKDDVSSGALPKDVCGSCAARFYSKQQFLVCSAGCSRKFHCKCLNVGLVEYNTYMETGTSTFKCSGCTRRCSLSPKAARASTSVNNENLNVMDGESASAQESLPFPASFMRVLETLSGKLDILTAEFQCLRAENRSLRSEVLQLRKNVLDRIPLIPSSRPLYATVTGLPPATPTPVPNSPPRSAWLPQNVQHQPSSTLRQEKHPGQTTSHPDEVSAVERDFPTRNFGLNGLQSANTVDDGFVPVKSRRRVKPSSGTAKPDKVNAAPPPVRHMALFVSRLDPETSVNDIEALIEPFLEGRTPVCSKMKTRFPSYSSFHLACDEAVFAALNKPEVWPEGSIFHQFFGRLDSTRVYNVETVAPDNGVNA